MQKTPVKTLTLIYVSFSLIQESETITDKKTLAHSLNSHYVNIVRKIKAPEIQGNPNNKTIDMSAAKSIIKKHENHGGIINIKTKVDKSENRYDITLATAEQNKVFEKLNPNKATALDKIPSKITLKVETSSNKRYRAVTTSNEQ